jgi:6-phospho-beta-glucosidase
LNHLGWVRRVLLDGEDVTDRLLSDESALLRVYPAHLFDPDMIRALRLIPTEYLFFYYGQHRAWENQRRAGASRGEEIQQMNAALFERMRAALRRDDPAQAVRVYKDYLNQRNSSYMRLEAEAESGLQEREHDWNPFEGATGYHRIAIDVMRALSSDTPRHVVVNVRNGGAVTGLLATDVVEVPSAIDRNGPRPLATGALPGTVQGLVLAVKEYERLAIQAAVMGSLEIAKVALLAYPIVGQWRIAGDVMNALRNASPGELGYLH